MKKIQATVTMNPEKEMIRIRAASRSLPLLLKLMAMADAVDPSLAPAPLKVSLAFPVPMKAGISPQTVVARTKVRAELGGEASGIDWNVLEQ